MNEPRRPDGGVQPVCSPKLPACQGMYAGTSVILPARAEAQLVAGPNCRTYVHPQDIVRHITEILAGGSDIEAERQFNRRFAQSQYADPALAMSFAAQLTQALAQWRSS